MKLTDNPLFTNSCGRIFNDRIQLASYKGETTVRVKDISSVSFRTKITAKGLLFALLPSLFIIASLLLNKSNTTEKYVFFFAGIIGMLLLLYLAERKYYVRINMRKGGRRDINVLAPNIKEAKKYVNETNKVVKASLKKETPETNSSVNINTANA